MNKLAFLEYIFMFNPEESWGHLYEFENQLAKFFTAQGLEAQIVKTVEGSGSRRILLIKRKPTMPVRSIDPKPKVLTKEAK